MPIIQVHMLCGRTHAQKTELAEVLTREAARIVKCTTEDIQIVITEVQRSNWAVNGQLGNPAPAVAAG